MKHWKYLPVQAFIYIVALMPFWVLYRIADIIFVIIYYVVRYRIKIVRKNIKDSFPELTTK